MGITSSSTPLFQCPLSSFLGGGGSSQIPSPAGEGAIHQWQWWQQWMLCHSWIVILPMSLESTVLVEASQGTQVLQESFLEFKVRTSSPMVWQTSNSLYLNNVA